MKITLRDPTTSLYLCAEGGGDDGGILVANRPAAGPWESFTLWSLANNRVAIETSNQRFLSMQRDGRVWANRARRSADPAIPASLRTVPDDLSEIPEDAWESFLLLQHDGTVSFQGWNRLAFGPFVTAPQPGGSRMARLHLDGADLRDETGRLVVLCGATDHSLYKRFLAGENIRPVLEDRRAAFAPALANPAARLILRIFGEASWIMRPSDFGDAYFRRLPEFRDLLAADDFLLHHVVLADCEALGQSLLEQQTLVDQVRDALAGQPTLISLVNEAEHGGTRVNQAAFQYPGGDALLWDRGSDLSGGTPFADPWDLVTHHPDRGHEWVTHGTDPIWLGRLHFGGLPARPIIADEIIRATAQESDPSAYELFARIWLASGGAGVYFHSDGGNRSTVWTPEERACATAFARGFALRS